jgi:hypothetical protein
VLLALATANRQRLARLLGNQPCVVLAIDSVNPDLLDEGLWLLRDCLSGEVLLARSMPSATTVDLAALLTEVKVALPLPIVTVVSDGQETIRQAAESALPDLPHRVWRYGAQ